MYLTSSKKRIYFTKPEDYMKTYSQQIAWMLNFKFFWNSSVSEINKTNTKDATCKGVSTVFITNQKPIL